MGASIIHQAAILVVLLSAVSLPAAVEAECNSVCCCSQGHADEQMQEQCRQLWFSAVTVGGSCPASAVQQAGSSLPPLAPTGSHAGDVRNATKNQCSSSIDRHSTAAEAAVQVEDGEGKLRDREVYIIRFNEYRMLSDIKTLISKSLASLQQHWSWVDRANKAAQQYPSDFALLSIAKPRVAELQQQLQQMPGFRDVHPDRRIRGSSNWQPEGPLAAAFSDVHLQQQQQQQQQPTLRQPPASLRLVQEQQQQHGAGDLQAPSRHLLADAQPSSSIKEGSSSQQQQQQPQPPSQQQQQQQEGDDQAGAGAADQEDSIWSVSKPPGRMSTKHTIGLDPKSQADRDAGYNRDELRRRRRGLLGWASSMFSWQDSGLEQHQQQHAGGRKLSQADSRVTTLLQAPELWKQGFSGKGIRVGVFDTGISEDHPHIRNIKERTNWTHQNSLSDGLGHGSFVAGVIGSQDSTCPGFAPDVELYTFKVFTDDQVSYTSWFMDAFNYAIVKQLHIINLSIGGPDFLDAPFVDKVLEVTSNGLIMISAIGNDGPLYGTLNNPADQPDVIGVGGIDNDNHIAAFSSRGMTTWELPAGTGRIKPDVMAYGKDVTGSKITSGCRSLSGTSVASPVVAGAACLLASTLPEERRWLLNPASMKQALVEGAVRIQDLNMYEQGNGRINLPASQAILAAYEPRASLIPPAIDFTNCPYMWPYCTQPLYAFGLPVAFNATVLNGMAVTGTFVDPPVYTATDKGGELLHVTFKYSDVLWPWSGYLAVYVEVSPAGWNFTGTASGTITFHIQSPPQYGTKSVQISKVSVPLTAKIIPTPPREKRVMWDVLHSVKYPPGYVPRDNLDIKSDVLDWHGDHPFTNFHETLNALREGGYFVEIMNSPATCFEPRNYGAYIIMDSEEEWYPEEVSALASAVKDHGLALVVFAEWYHLESLKQMKFFDDNTRSWWTPITGGANVPALNDLLAPHNISLGEHILQGTAQLGKHKVTISHGSNIAKFPAGGFLHITHMNDASGKGTAAPGDFAPFGITPSGAGQVAVLGDTNCLDSSHMVSPCFEFLLDLLGALLSKKESSLTSTDKQLSEAYTAPGFAALPQRREDVNFTRYSWVLQHPLSCAVSSPCQFRNASKCPAADQAWQYKHLEPGKEPPQTWGKPVEPSPTPVDTSRTVQERPQQFVTPAATPLELAGAATKQQQAQQQQQQQKQESPGAFVPEGSAAGREEAAQQRQRKAFVSQAASWATLICIVGVMGLVVLWQMRSGQQANGGRRWMPRSLGRYSRVQQSPMDRMV